MPSEKWVIKDTVTGLFLAYYSTALEFCSWSTVQNAIEWDTEAEAQAVIDTWGDQGGRFIGINPPPR